MKTKRSCFENGKGKDNRSLLEWAAEAEQYALPTWDALPSIPLYMDQVTMVTGEALALFACGESRAC